MVIKLARTHDICENFYNLCLSTIVLLFNNLRDSLKSHVIINL